MRAIEQQPRVPRQLQTQHAEAQAFGGLPAAAEDDAGAEGEPGRPARQGAGPAPLAPGRSGPRVGRNDPCPCGSGKKYKKCHMPTDAGVGTRS